MKSYILALLCSCLACFAAESKGPTLAEEKQQAIKRIGETPNLAIVAVDGLCCKNCAIGIGKKVRKLDFVDLKLLNKGIAVDKDRFLLEVALKEGTKLDQPAIAHAIRKAGYEPVRIYERGSGEDVTVAVVPPKK